jgi:hypothetical protein
MIPLLFINTRNSSSWSWVNDEGSVKPGGGGEGNSLSCFISSSLSSSVSDSGSMVVDADTDEDLSAADVRLLEVLDILAKG